MTELDEDKDTAKQVEVRRPSEDPWAVLRALTPARIGLGRSGAAVRTPVHLAFQAAHAMARDAVFTPFSPEDFATRLTNELGLVAVPVATLATDRTTYLKRPDTGRRLAPESQRRLEAMRGADALGSRPDVGLVICDGLSASGIELHGVPLVRAFVDALSTVGLTLGPIAVARHGRVALGDPIGEALRAKLVMVVIGERPGLSAADSVGVYLTFGPRSGRTDAERNCISNIHPPDGLDYVAAAQKAAWLAREGLRRSYTGVHLKDESVDGLALVDELESLPDR